MGRFSKHWTFLQRTKWLFTGVGPTDMDAVESELRQMHHLQLERNLELIEIKHKIACEAEKATFIQTWMQQ